MLAVPGTLAAPSRALPLTIAITGKGMVRLGTGRQVACAASCRRVILVRADRRITLSTQPASGWKFGAWAGACRGTGRTCKLRVTRAARVNASFIPPGARKNPIPLGTEGFIDAGPPALGLVTAWGFEWGLKVLSSRLEQNHLIVQLSATAHGSALILYQLQANIFLAGRIREYSPGAVGPNPCTPPAPDLLSILGHYLGPPGFFGLLEGETLTGYLCFQVDPIDAPFLLFTEPPLRSLNPSSVPSYPPDAEAVWFALR